MFGCMYVKCSHCGLMTDEWAFDPVTKKYTCFNCEEEEERKKEAADNKTE